MQSRTALSISMFPLMHCWIQATKHFILLQSGWLPHVGAVQMVSARLDFSIEKQLAVSHKNGQPQFDPCILGLHIPSSYFSFLLTLLWASIGERQGTNEVNTDK